MSGSKAKQLRKAIFGDTSRKARKYTINGNGTVFEIGLHGAYKRLKKSYRGNPKARESFKRGGC